MSFPSIGSDLVRHTGPVHFRNRLPAGHRPSLDSPRSEAQTVANVFEAAYNHPVQVFSGRSYQVDAKQAIDEAVSGWRLDGTNLDIILVFASTQQDPDQVAQHAQARFPNTLVVGCTSTGENFQGEFSSGALVIAGLSTPEIQWSCAIAKNLDQRDEAQVQGAIRTLFEDASIDAESLDTSQHFCLMFLDGLKMAEEWASSIAADCLEGIALVGGSAGDDLAFQSTKVFYRGEALENTALFLLGKCPSRCFSVFKHQHFTATTKRLVVTRCDPSKRLVYELNGFPAIEAYARALGSETTQIPQDHVFMAPLTISVNNELYVRSVQQSSNDDGSLKFHCAIEDGMVLHIADHHEMAATLQSDLQALATPGKKVGFLLSFNCILRRLEANQGDTAEKIKHVVNNIAESSIGFDTYGEQYNGLHINQTMVGIALG